MSYTVWRRTVEDDLSDEHLMVSNVPSFTLAEGLAKTFNELDTDHHYFVEVD